MGRHDEHRLREFVAARRRGDEAAARGWWDELVSDNFDRVVAMVRLESRDRLSREEQADAIQRALVKLSTKMIDTFEGQSMGQWVNATAKLVQFACIDTQRAYARAPKAAALTVGEDEEREHPGLAGAARLAWETEALDAEDAAALDGLVERGRRFLDWALPQLTAKPRAVYERDLLGVPSAGIAAELGMTEQAVYKARERAVKRIDELREQWEDAS